MNIALLKNCDDSAAPGRLWSLWDMLFSYGHAFFVFARQLQQIDNFINLTEHNNSLEFKIMKIINNIKYQLFGIDSYKKIDAITTQILAALDKFCEIVILPSVAIQIERVRGELKSHRGTRNVMAPLRELGNRIQDILEVEQFLYVRPDLIKYYNSKIFGEEIVIDSQGRLMISKAPETV
jgi:hypothetical protein